MLASCFIAGWFFLVADDFKQLSKHIAGGAFFVSNLILIQEAGYFDNASFTKPLLHLWSLGIEEQFYLAWPLILYFLWRFRTNIGLIVSTLLLLSLGYNLYLINIDLTAIYFSPLTRAWELLAGGLLAWRQMYTPHAATPKQRLKITEQHQTLLTHITSIAGLALIGAGLMLIDETQPFPGYLALVPVCGALLLMASGPMACFNRYWLSRRWMVSIGLISYPLYLWHWPLLAFGRILYPTSASGMYFNLAAIALSLVFATLTYRFIEQPVRNMSNVSSSSVKLFFAMLIVGLIGIGTLWNNGFENRKVTDQYTHKQLVGLLKNNYGLARQCSRNGSFDLSMCANHPNPDVLLWGDSYAMHLAQALNESPTPIAFRQQTMSACRPILNFAVVGDRMYNQAWAERCIEHNQEVIEWLGVHPEIRYVVLASPFNFLNKALIDHQEITVPDDIFVQKLQETVSQLIRMGKKPVIIAPPPPSGFDTGNCWKAHIVNQSQHECDFSKQSSDEIAANVYNRLARVNHLAPIIHLSSFICEHDICHATIDGQPQYRDKGHLSAVGSGALGKKYDLAGKILQTADEFYQ